MLFLTSSRWPIRSFIDVVHWSTCVELNVLNIFKVVKEVGKMMMEKAYMGEPSVKEGLSPMKNSYNVFETSICRIIQLFATSNFL